MPPGLISAAVASWHGSDKQADVLEATSLTQTVWELRHSLPGVGGRRQGQDRLLTHPFLPASVFPSSGVWKEPGNEGVFCEG